jgi:choline dehydrogenase
MVCQQVSQKDTINDQFTPMKLITHLYQYVVHKKGLLNTPSSEVVAFFSSGANDTRPDCQIHFTPASGYRDNQGKSHMDKVSGVTAMVYPTRPTSRGSVHIASKKVDESPVIIANYLSTDYDRNTTLAGLAKVREIFKQASFKEINQGEIRPGKERQNDTSLLEYIAQTSTTSYHPVGTCKMGNDRMAVVDNTLKVHGIQALRIIDASIMPSICSGNTHAATLMIAEKAADMILHKT